MTGVTMKRGALAGVAQLVGVLSHNWKVMRLICSQGTYLGCGFDPWSGRVQYLFWVCTVGNQSMFLSYQCFFLSLPLFLKAMKKISSGECLKKKKKKKRWDLATETDTHRRRWCEDTHGDDGHLTRVIICKPRNVQQPEATRGKERFSLRAVRKSKALIDTLILASSLQSWEAN